MVRIKTKEATSAWIGLLAAVIVAGLLVAIHAQGYPVRWIPAVIVVLCTFSVVTSVALFLIRKYVSYKLKPIYSIVLSRDVHTKEIFSELKDKKVEDIGEELTAWADTNDKGIARLKEAEQFRKQYLGNVAHELKTPIFNVQGYISTLLDGGLEDELINRKYLERAEKSIDRLINIDNDLDTISKLESSMNKLDMEKFDVVALAKEIAGKMAPTQKYVRGFYTGGTLCDEAMKLLIGELGHIQSNIPLNPEDNLENARTAPSVRHTFLDFGDDAFTVGRPHPMIDPSLRAERVVQEASDPEAAVVLVDCVIGYGSHEDPAADLADAIRAAKAEASKNGRHLAVVASVCGTEGDPQSRSATQMKLADAGAIVLPTNAQATRFAQLILRRL